MMYGVILVKRIRCALRMQVDFVCIARVHATTFGGHTPRGDVAYTVYGVRTLRATVRLRITHYSILYYYIVRVHFYIFSLGIFLP